MVKKHTKATRTAERSVGETQSCDVSVSEEQVTRERTQMLVERQAELDSVLDRHDDMVRVVPFCAYDGWGIQIWLVFATVNAGPRGVSSRTVCDVARVRSQGRLLGCPSGRWAYACI